MCYPGPWLLPFGSHFFSNLLHYVRTGDFVDALISDAQDINEYAFALGALGHYLADNNGLIATPLPGSGGDGETRSARIRLELASLTVTQSSMIAH
jgi:hypothetical protein